MSYSAETLDKIRAFAARQAAAHLENAEISYLIQLEKQRREARGGLPAEKLQEAEEDMVAYICDWVSAMMADGCPEDEALAHALDAMAADDPSRETLELRQRYEEYFDDDGLTNRVISGYEEAIIIAGLATGCLVGGLLAYFNPFGHRVWTFVIAAFCCLMFGVAISQALTAALRQQRNRRRPR